MHEKGSYSQKMLCSSSHFLLLQSLILITLPVEDKRPGDQSTVIIENEPESPGSSSSEPSSSEPSSTETSRTGTSNTEASKSRPATTASTLSASPIATSFAIYPNDATEIALNNAFQSAMYQLVEPSTVYVSSDDVGILFWLADLTEEQVQSLSNFGFYFHYLRASGTESSLVARGP